METGASISEARALARRRRNFRIRVSVLLAILLGVVVYAVRDVQRRRARNDWDRPLVVALVVLRVGPVDDTAVAALRGRVPALADRLAAERRRHRPGAVRPFRFAVFGPIDVKKAPPVPAGDGLLDLARQAYDQWRYVRQVDRALALDPGAFDARVYVAAAAPKSARRSQVEGTGEQGGRVGSVRVELGEGMEDFALFVATHELMHVLGATDKYDADGLALVPEGLAEPDLEPRFPQRLAEIMARGRPVAPGEERVPESLDELSVGPLTAREIGWLRP